MHEEAGARRAATRGGAKMTLIDRRRFLSGAAMTIVAAQLGMIGCAREQSSEDTPGPLMSQATHPAAAPLTEMPSLDSATEWLNS